MQIYKSEISSFYTSYTYIHILVYVSFSTRGVGRFLASHSRCDVGSATSAFALLAYSCSGSCL